jgi:hypothetical protein
VENPSPARSSVPGRARDRRRGQGFDLGVRAAAGRRLRPAACPLSRCSRRGTGADAADRAGTGGVVLRRVRLVPLLAPGRHRKARRGTIHGGRHSGVEILAVRGAGSVAADRRGDACGQGHDAAAVCHRQLPTSFSRQARR